MTRCLSDQGGAASALEPYLGASPYPHDGKRVVIGQRMMQAQSDIFLDGLPSGAGIYYGRQLRDMKFSVDVGDGPGAFYSLCPVCGATLAPAHARTSDPAQISGYLGRKIGLTRPLLPLPSVCRPGRRDHAALLAAMKDGRVQAQVGV